MTRSAARIEPRLRFVIEELAGGRLSMINRRAGVVAEQLGATRPSYERVRLIVHQVRALRRGPGLGEVMLNVAFRADPPDAVVSHLAGTYSTRR